MNRFLAKLYYLYDRDGKVNHNSIQFTAGIKQLGSGLTYSFWTEVSKKTRQVSNIKNHGMFGLSNNELLYIDRGLRKSCPSDSTSSM